MPTREHEDGVGTLATLAALIGCDADFELPDGRRPDVVRYDAAYQTLFIGEAKHSESPEDRDALRRLEAYFPWIRAHRDSGRRSVILALNVTAHGEVIAWRRALLELVAVSDLPEPTVYVESVGEDEVVILGWRQG